MRCSVTTALSVFLGLSLALLFVPSKAQAQVLQAAAAPESDFLRQNCFGCHNERRSTAGLALDLLDRDRVGQDTAVWEKVVRKLRTRMMPPQGRPRPDEASLNSFVRSLETALDTEALAHPDPGRPAAHRLNRTEYANAVRDLLALKIDVRRLLPADDLAHGFDNLADVLSVSPTLMERYLSAARYVSRLAVGPATVRPTLETHRISANRPQGSRNSDDLPFGSRGGAAVQHYFPVDGEYLVRVRLQRTYVGYIRGIGQRHQLEVRVDRERVSTLHVGGEDRGRPAPASYAGEIFGAEGWEDYLHRADELLEVRFSVKAGWRVVSVVFAKSKALPEGPLQPIDRSSFNYAVDEMPYGEPAVESISVGGPYESSGPGDTPSRQRIFVCLPASTLASDERVCAMKILSTLARRAYRRPVDSADVDVLMSFYDAARTDGSFDTGVQGGIERLLVDPEFLFRIERDPPGTPPATPYHVSDLELASRLSFFLWSSIPDDELLNAAERGELKEQGTLDQQVRRMFKDSRANALVGSFFMNWLHLNTITSVSPDIARYPEFNENLREAMERETRLFLEYQLKGDRSIIELLNADYTFVNEELARHYGIEGVYGPHFRLVALPDRTRGGILGHASVLTTTSYANRTSPVKRGLWLLENFLGVPPPVPPSDVPALEEQDQTRPTSVRERMEQHRANPVCASCHRVIDPPGFAFENFDAIGRWRTLSDERTPYDKERRSIDASGAMADGSEFEGAAEMREILLETRRDEFLTIVVEKILTYALGRGLEPPDMQVVRSVVRDASAADFRWSSIISSIVKSVPFQMRRSAS